MATAEEIRRRVHDAESARIERRASSAAAVAEQHAKRTATQQQLDQEDRELAQTVQAALREMTRDELARFLDVRRSQIDEWSSAGSKRRRSSSSRPRSSRASQAGSASNDTTPHTGATEFRSDAEQSSDEQLTS